jgi:NAD(P)-dependent dehydrogenase (short-subunit alcohol dehydrogenase family)
MAMTEFGRLDILINNAAFQRTHTDLAEFTAEEVEHTFRTNIESMFFLSREAGFASTRWRPDPCGRPAAGP